MTPEQPLPDPSLRKPMRRGSALETLSRWFWSAWTISNSETHGSLVESFDVVDNSYLFAPPIDDDEAHRRARLHGHCHTDVDDPFPCKTCHARGVVCDGRRPRCSHCLDQQVLCFYVAPIKRSKKGSRSAQLAFEQGQLQMPLGEG